MFMPITDPAIALPQAIEITKKQTPRSSNSLKWPQWSRRLRELRPPPIRRH